MGAPTGVYTRDMFDENLRYLYAVVQNGVPWVDADDNDNRMSALNQRRRIEEILGTGSADDGFLCEEVVQNDDFDIRGGDGTADGAGRFWHRGMACTLFADTVYKNTGANEDGVSIHPRITVLSYSAPNTTLRDSAANWDVNEHAGKTITPDITQPASTFAVVSNTANEMIITGDVTAIAVVGDHYRIELVVSGARVDGVFVNMYLDEYDNDDDPNLEHNLGSNVVAQLRSKLIQNVYVKEGSLSFPDYVDSDGNQHYTFMISKINRDGGGGVTSIEDLRPIWSGDYASVWTNINTLTGDIVNYASSLWLRPHNRTSNDDRITIEDGVYVRPTDGLRPIIISSAFDVGPFAAAAGGKERWYLVTMDAGGAAVINAGSEVNDGTGSVADAPAIPTDELAVAIVRVDDSATIESGDVYDVREFLNKGAGGGGGGGALGIADIEEFTADAGDTAFVLSQFTYTPGTNEIMVYSGGLYMRVVQDYVETNSSTITFTVPRGEDERIVVIKTGPAGGGGGSTDTRPVEAMSASDLLTTAEGWKVFTNEGAGGQVVLTLPTAAAGVHYSFYVQAAQNLRVLAGGADTIRINTLVSISAGYVESSTIGSTITLVAINATEWVALSQLGTWTVETV